MTTQHTPGPWALEGLDFPNTQFIRGADGKAVALAHSDERPEWSHKHVDGATGQANAHLIAAAPEMLAALKRLVANWDANMGPDLLGPDMPPRNNAIEAARAAIAKAEGRS